ncbi:TIE2-like protein [Mya arenaria]|uniref:TIE2-like protein n=1 Tax=Mya arenaria TaxID=6604 RepID=A0ABY7DBA1_MYAAR|nr:TIE2-like protein [Mya arenaria]
MFTVVGKDENDFTLVWSNQNRFNNLRFEFDTLINIPEIPERPVYVHDARIGIVASSIEASVSKIPRDGGSTRYIASNKTYNCETGISEDNPAVEKNTCEIYDENFATLIEHGDILLLKFRSRSGGFQKLINIDNQGKPFATKHYNGLQGQENLEFRFDFIVPEHCSLDSGSCLSKPLHIDDEFTRSTIQVRWSDWTDAMSGMWQYYFEVFKLQPNRDGKLEEATPINPVFNRTLNHTDGEISSSFTPDEPGMYSVLLKLSDMANNSRIARRFVLYDDTSVISVSNETDKKLYFSSAMEETGYAWQTPSNNNDTTVTVNVSWDGHANKLHEDGKFLAEIEEFPIQFKEIEDEGIFMSLKFVSDSLDDDEGERTRQAIPNYHGIVQFEVAYEQSASEEVPTGWSVVGLHERTSSQRTLENGDRLRVWIRATDVMGNTRTDSTLMRIDGSPPTISTNFLASDRQSGVHKIGIKLIVKLPGKDGLVAYDNFTEAMRGDGDVEDPRCIGLDQNDRCLLPEQIVDIDNCWLTDLNGEIQMQSFEFLSTLAYFDIAGLYPEVEYNVELRLRADNGHVRQVGENLSVVTPHFSQEEDLSRVFPTGAVVGITVGILLLCVIFVLLFIKIRGNIKEKRKKIAMPRAITNRVHPSASESNKGSLHEIHNNENENLQSELYLYGEMNFNSSSKGYISSDNITFIAFWKSGHFANIYHAQDFSKNDELLMKAKLNFSSVKAGDHPNVIKFVGAVVDNVALGPIIIYELCEIGSLRHHLQKNKYNFIIKMQENLFRFGLDVAKGMEFLAFRGVTHRRLAARNILLNFLNEAKIAGFGPQPSGKDNGGEAVSMSCAIKMDF